MRRFTASLLLLCLAAATTFGGGYQVGLHSMRNIGMGLIGTSLSNDASAYFYNPAGGAFIPERFSFSGGASFLMSRSTFQATNMLYQTNNDFIVNTPFYLYAAFKPYDQLSIGLAVNTPFGNKLSWPNEWVGKYLIQNLKFKAITVQPSFAYKFNNIVSAGIGMVMAIGTVELNKALPLDSTGGEGALNVKGSTFNVGVNVGVMVKPVKGLSLGLDYRSRIQMTVDDATADFTVPGALQTSFPDGVVSTGLPLVANLDFGASYQINDKWMVGMNLCYVFWSQYDSLIFSFQEKTAAVNRTAMPALWENKLIVRAGAEFRINKIVTIRAGGYYDPTPVPDGYLNPQTPSSNQVGMTCGLSVFPMKGLSIDAAFLYVMGMERTGTYSPDNFPGTYKTATYSPGIGLTYNF
jgi:long-chain fatty acid transport protein